MFVTKLKIVAVTLLLVSVLAVGGVLSHRLTAAPQPEAQADEPPVKPKDGDKKDAKRVAVQVVKPTPGGLARTVRRSARIVAAQQQRVVPLVSGTIKEVLVDVGDRVKKGQTLMVLDAPLLAKEWEQATSAFEMAQAEEQEAEARVVIAEAETEAAEALFNARAAEKAAAVDERTKRQLQLKFLQRSAETLAERVLKEAENKVAAAEGQIKVAEAAVAAARAEIRIKKGKVAHAKAALTAAHAATRTAHAVMDKARIQESFTQLTAAFDGVVTRRSADPGNFVQPSDSRLLIPLLTVQRTDQVRVVVEVEERDAPFVSLGDAVDLQLDALPGVALGGQKIARFSPVLDASNKTMTVEIDVANADGRLLPGMSGAVTIHFKKRLANALVVPSSCLVVWGLSQRSVYVVRDGKAHRTDVTITAEQGKNVEIVEGVKASDLIVSDPSKLVKLGEEVPVEIKKAP